MFNEDNTVEQMLIEAATQSSWQYVKSQDIPRSSDSVLVEKKYNFTKAIFPGTQGGPLMHVIAAKAVCFVEALKPEF